MTKQEENELICERLLGWIMCDREKEHYPWWSLPDGTERSTHATPSFTTWAEAGLILDALSGPVVWRTDAGWHAHCNHEWEFTIHTTGPLAIRAAALAYLVAT